MTLRIQKLGSLLLFPILLAMSACSGRMQPISREDSALHFASETQLVARLKAELAKPAAERNNTTKIENRLLQIRPYYAGHTDSVEKLDAKFKEFVEIPLQEKERAERDSLAKRIEAAKRSFASRKSGLSVDQLHLFKREFETKEQFEHRKAQVKDSSRFIVTRDVEAAAYDVDTELLSISLTEKAHCQNQGEFSSPICKRLVSLLVKDDTKYGEYTGSNAFGASRKIAKKRGFETFIGVTNSLPLLNFTGQKLRFEVPLTKGKILGDIPMQPELARNFRSGQRKIGARFSFVPCPIGQDCSVSNLLEINPTIQYPIDVNVLELIHQLHLESVVFFEKGTNRVLDCFVAES